MRSEEKHTEAKEKQTRTTEEQLSHSDKVINASLKLRLLGDYVEGLSGITRRPDFSKIELYTKSDVTMWLQSIFPDSGLNYEVKFHGFLLDKQAGLQITNEREAFYELSHRLIRIHQDNSKTVMVPALYRNPKILDTLINNSIEELLKMSILPIYATITLKGVKEGTGRYLRFSRNSELVPIEINTQSDEYKEIREYLHTLKDTYLSNTAQK